MRCPICKTEVDSTGPHAPFCSQRCALIDLANWATGKYVISTPIGPESPPEKDDGDTGAE